MKIRRMATLRGKIAGVASVTAYTTARDSSSRHRLYQNEHGILNGGSGVKVSGIGVAGGSINDNRGSSKQARIKVSAGV